MGAAVVKVEAIARRRHADRLEPSPVLNLDDRRTQTVGHLIDTAPGLVASDVTEDIHGHLNLQALVSLLIRCAPARGLPYCSAVTPDDSPSTATLTLRCPSGQVVGAKGDRVWGQHVLSGEAIFAESINESADRVVPVSTEAVPIAVQSGDGPGRRKSGRHANRDSTRTARRSR